jgi:caa(3)-type oxidase subunit IV
MAKNKDAHHDEHRPNVKAYLMIGGALFVLTVVTVWISKFHLAKGPAIALGLAVATLKAGLVAAVFMHLWGGEKLIHRILWVTVFFGAILVLPLLDAKLVLSRLLSPMPVADQHPAPHGEAHGGHQESVVETLKVDKPLKAPKGAH